jgi:uncharacterized protein YbbC (DUF1343 family)
MKPFSVLTGIDSLLASPSRWKGLRIGMVTNAAAMVSGGAGFGGAALEASASGSPAFEGSGPGGTVSGGAGAGSAASGSAASDDDVSGGAASGSAGAGSVGARGAALRPSRVALLEAGFRLVKLFSPEHGLSARGVDGRPMADGVDVLTGLPVCSLYGDRLAPGEAELADVDLVLFDIPDVGSRFYTYLWTLTHVMEACARWGKPLVVADRPNPISGRMELVEGPMLDEDGCSSFIGRWELPVRHSCTLGELASWFNASRGIGCALEVVRCVGWERRMFFPDLGMPFVPLSPAIPSFESALLYPGLCFFEATNVSEGRGTDRPFQLVGAPWMKSEEVVREFDERMSSVTARAIEFVPVEGKWAGERCPGVLLEVRDVARFRPVETGWLLLAVVRALHPGRFEWAPYVTHVNPVGRRHLDLLAGLRDAEKLIEHGANDLASIRRHTDAPDWVERIKPYLLYG